MSDYESRETRYETITVDRREAYYERSAKFRNPNYDFSARFNRGEAYQKSMGWIPVKAPVEVVDDKNVVWLAQQKAKRG